MIDGKRVMLSVVSCALAGAGLAGCATAAANDPHNPAASSGVAAICRNVLGLSPSERLTGGNWMGTDKLDYWTSHYRGCLVSLSDSQQGARDTAVVQQAEDRCRAKGLQLGSPDLALCVLQSANEHPEPAPTQATATTQATAAARATVATQAPAAEPTAAPGSFYFASTSEIARREQVACAALGLSPAQAEFKGCVQQLRATFYAIDHPIN
jgi:hypothetical protein